MNYKSLLSACIGLVAMTPVAFATAPYDYAVGDTFTYDYTTYTVKGENLFTNPSFDQGKEGWINGLEQELGSEFEVITTGGADGGAYLKALSDGGSGSAAALRAYIELTPGKTYYFSAFGKNISDVWKRLCLNSEPSTTGCKDHIVDITGGNDWTQSAGVFTAGENDKYAVLQCGWCASTACFDSFFLAEVELAEELQRPVLFNESQPYYFYNEKSGAYLSAKDGWITLQNLDEEGYNQVFSVEAAPENATSEGFNILNWGNGYIFQGSTKWDTCVGTDANASDDKTIFVVAGEPDDITLKVVSSNYMGADNFAPGAGVYLDKSGNNTIHFKLIPADAEPDQTIMYDIFEEVMAFMEDVEIGTEAGQYPEAAYEGIIEALESAEEAFEATTQKEIIEAAAVLRAAFNDFKASVNVAQVEIKHGIYRLVHAESGAYFYTGWHENANCAIYIGGEFRTDYKGEFEVECVETETLKAYSFKSEDGYLVNNNNSLAFAASLPAGTDGLFQALDEDGKVALKNMTTGKYVGPQWGGYYSWVHGVADHAGDNGQHLFNLELVKDLTETTGIENIADNNGAKISTTAGAIIVEGAQTVTVYTVAGVAVAEASAEYATLPVAPGAYIVRADNTAKVVIVK